MGGTSIGSPVALASGGDCHAGNSTRDGNQAGILEAGAGAALPQLCGPYTDVRPMWRGLRSRFALLPCVRRRTRRERARPFRGLQREISVRNADPGSNESICGFSSNVRNRRILRDRGRRCGFYLFGDNLGGLASGSDLAHGVDARLHNRNARGVAAEELWATRANQLDLFAAKCGGGLEAALQPPVPATREKKI